MHVCTHAQITHARKHARLLACSYARTRKAYFGDSGGRFAESETQLELTDAFIERSNGAHPRVSAPAWQLLYKPVGGGKVAVLAMNSNKEVQTLNVEFASVPRACVRACVPLCRCLYRCRLAADACAMPRHVAHPTFLPRSLAMRL